MYRNIVSQPVTIRGKSVITKAEGPGSPSLKPFDIANNPSNLVDSTIPSAKVLIGFKEDDSLDQIFLGEPFKFYLFKNEALLNYARGGDVSSLLSQIDEFYFPVMMGENAETLLIVAKINNSWRAVSFGGRKTLAVELDKIRKHWPLGQGYTPLLVEIDDKYLFTVPQYDSKNLTILSLRGEKDYSRLEYHIDFIEGLIKSRIKE